MYCSIRNSKAPNCFFFPFKDDFRSERIEVKRAKGPNCPFSFGDYVAKSIIGILFRKIRFNSKKRIFLVFFRFYRSRN